MAKTSDQHIEGLLRLYPWPWRVKGSGHFRLLCDSNNGQVAYGIYKLCRGLLELARQWVERQEAEMAAPQRQKGAKKQ